MRMKMLSVAVWRILALLAVPAGLLSADNSPAPYIIIPECIWAAATGGGTWVTELQITDMGNGSVITAQFYCAGGQSAGVANIWTSPAKYHSVKFANILSTLQSLDPSFTFYGKVGTLCLFTQDSAHLIQAQVRTVNGNYGKTYQGLTYTDTNSANLGRNMMIMNLTQNDTYRTFVGCWNATGGGYWITAEFSIISSGNGLVGSRFYRTFDSWAFSSFNPFVEAGVGTGTYDDCWLLIHITGSGNSDAGAVGLMCFGSSANNYTNDTSAHIAVQFQ